ncbi:cell wall-active antibiotic response 4TMS protein YvqF [Thermomonospora umbrina]|uniref:Cell wall-active antibiotic response 4TMS protein YvqF n=2 Tax=Thermomonospora umbrina TaxID=111806 RepID=A0A3D9SU23_9ACTN|nr:cell wall-active antibiotic response 4TMS protein YvqF [Thermomonospora umbrina]
MPAGPAGSVRASDAEREAVVELLRIASVEGRLTFAELTERCQAAYCAATRGELERVTSDLPGVGAPGADPAPRLETRRFSAVMGDARERVIGRIEEELNVLSVMGDLVLDLRDAQVPRGEVTIVATAVMGDVKIIVPDGVEVRMSGYGVMGDRRVRTRRPEPGCVVPVVHVRAQAVMGDIKIVDDEHDGRARRAFTSWWEDRKSRH